MSLEFLGVVAASVTAVLTALIGWWVRSSKIRAERANEERKADEESRKAEWQEFRASYSESNDLLRKDRDFYRDAYFKDRETTAAQITAMRSELVAMASKHEAEVNAVRSEAVRERSELESVLQIERNKYSELKAEFQSYKSKSDAERQGFNEEIFTLQTELRQQKLERELERETFRAEIDSLRANVAALLPTVQDIEATNNGGKETLADSHVAEPQA